MSGGVAEMKTSLSAPNMSSMSWSLSLLGKTCCSDVSQRFWGFPAPQIGLRCD